MEVANRERGKECKVTNDPLLTMVEEAKTSGVVVPNQTLLVDNSFVVQVMSVVVPIRFAVVTIEICGGMVSGATVTTTDSLISLQLV